MTGGATNKTNNAHSNNSSVVVVVVQFVFPLSIVFWLVIFNSRRDVVESQHRRCSGFLPAKVQSNDKLCLSMLRVVPSNVEQVFHRILCFPPSDCSSLLPEAVARHYATRQHATTRKKSKLSWIVSQRVAENSLHFEYENQEMKQKTAKREKTPAGEKKTATTSASKVKGDRRWTSVEMAECRRLLGLQT